MTELSLKGLGSSLNGRYYGKLRRTECQKRPGKSLFFFLSEELNAQVSWKFRILREIVIYTQDLRDTGEQ